MAIRAEEIEAVAHGTVDIARDRRLVVRHQRGDDEAFDELYRRYHDRLVAYCHRRVGDRHVAEELAQEAFVRALRAMPRFAGERRFYPWMTVIAQRLCIDHHRRSGRVEPTPVVDLGTVEADHEALWLAVDRAHLQDAVDRLAPRHREILELREQRGWSYQQIAAHLDVPLTTIEALLHRARKALRREYLAVAGDDAGRFGALGGFGAILAKAKGWLLGLGPDRWGPAVAAATAAAGLTVAGVVLTPEQDRPGADQVVEAAEAGSTVTTAAATADAGSPAAATVEVLTPAAPVTVARPAPARGAGAGPAPAAEVGPVGVFSSAEGQAYVDEQVESMPFLVDLGLVRLGVDPADLLAPSGDPEEQPGATIEPGGNTG